jgi:ferredoxin-NADP reductase
MTRKYALITCAYANCQNTEIKITVTTAAPAGTGERARYCCEDHEMMGAVRRALIAAQFRSFKYEEIARAEKILKELIGDGK